MTWIIADADKIGPAEFLRALTGKPEPDRALEAAYLEHLNAHFREARAKAQSLVRRDGEKMIDFVCRQMAILNAHEAWEREQRNAWANGCWKAPEQRRRAA